MGQLSEAREHFTRQLHARIDEHKKVRDVISPFVDYLDRGWDLSREEQVTRTRVLKLGEEKSRSAPSSLSVRGQPARPHRDPSGHPKPQGVPQGRRVR